MPKLSAEQIAVYLRNISGWKAIDDALVKSFEFSRFSDSIQFVNQVANIAESINHHPEIHIRFPRVTITLKTHDVNGITGKDFLLAEQIESIQKS